MKSKKKTIGIIIALLIIIAGAAFAYFCFCTDIFKTPEELFYKYVGKATQTEENFSYQETLEKLKKAQTQAYTGKTKIGIELKSTGNSYASMKNQAKFNVINGLGLEIETKSKPSENKSAYNMKLNYAGTDITELKLVKNDDIYGVKSEFLDNKYIAVENKDLKSFVKKLGGTTSGIPDKLEFLDIYELMYISKEDQNKIENTYQKIIKENITPEKFVKVENVIQKINNEDKNTTVYSLKISEKEFYKLILQLLETAKQDETILKLIVDKVNTFIKSNPVIQNYINEENSEKSGFTKETLQKSIEKILEELKDDEKYAEENSVTEFVIYVANGETVRMEFRLNDEVQMAADFYTVEDKKHVDLYAVDNGYSKYSSYNKATSSKRKTEELEKVMEMEYKKIKNGEETKTEGKIVIFEDKEDIIKMSFDITAKGKTGQGKNEKQCKINIEADEMSIGLTIDSELEYTDNVEIDELNDKNATIINKMDKAELEKFFNKIGENFEEKIQSKMKELGLVNSTKSKSTIPSLFN
ncbi:MAG: hypothetical protein IKF38_06845 [Clostridia bacterium]|nr:hypothetical protein [Clostridia bacterium]